MSFADHYLSKHSPFISYIEEPPSGLLSFIVVIPVYLEEKVILTLESIKSTIMPKGDIEVLLIVNYSEKDTEENKLFNNKTYEELLNWCTINSTHKLKFFSLLAANMPSKHAGVGLARKIGMDQAVNRFNQIDRDAGLILSLDADTIVDTNYFQAIESTMFNNAGLKYGGYIIYFEHQLEGKEFEKEVYDAIIQYELYLRYYKYALKYAGFPFYEYTIGSCFGVRVGIYAQQGGMNRRHGGEDFYFLHKLFPHKPFAFISETRVYPSPRPSLRVPFGTGPVIEKMLNDYAGIYFTYSTQSFDDLKFLFERIKFLYQKSEEYLQNEINSMPESIKAFLNENDFNLKIAEIMNNSASQGSFIKRFFQWFDGFMVVKFLNFSHNKFYSKQPVVEAVRLFLKEEINHIEKKDALNLLFYFRDIDKKTNN